MNHFLIQSSQINAQHQITLTQEQLEHLLKTLKKQPGKRVRVGLIGSKRGEAKIAHLSEDAPFHLKLLTETLVQAPTKLDVSVVLAMPRPPVLRRLISALTSMGVQSIMLIETQRTEKSYWQSPVLKESAIKKAVSDGLIQSRDTIPPQINIRIGWRTIIKEAMAAIEGGEQVFYGHPDSDSTQNIPRSGWIFLGPEGGFTEKECQELDSIGAIRLSLGERPLRCETAAIALVSRFI